MAVNRVRAPQWAGADDLSDLLTAKARNCLSSFRLYDRLLAIDGRYMISSASVEGIRDNRRDMCSALLLSHAKLPPLAARRTSERVESA
jgi:hypothetical protein